MVAPFLDLETSTRYTFRSSHVAKPLRFSIVDVADCEIISVQTMFSHLSTRKNPFVRDLDFSVVRSLVQFFQPYYKET